MPLVYVTTQAASGGGGVTGRVYVETSTAGVAGLLSLVVPDTVIAVDRKPCFVTYRTKTYILGTFSPGLVLTESLTLDEIGIHKPQTAFTCTSTGAYSFIAYLTFCQKDGTKTIIESSPSGPLEDTTGGTTRTWGSIPTKPRNKRTTHVRGYLSVDGADARRVWERVLGTTSVVESVDLESLGSVMVTGREPPPYCAFGSVYHERMWYAGDPKNPDRIYYSLVTEPEAVTATNFLLTPNREAVSGIAAVKDMLVVFCANSTHVIQGYTASDFQIRTVSPSIGCVSHHSIVNIHDRLWFASQTGVYVYDGSFQYVMSDMRRYWVDDIGEKPAAYDNCWAYDDRTENCYILVVQESASPLTTRYVGYYLPFEPNAGGGGDQPWWAWDVRARLDTAAGLVSDAGTRRFVVYNGSTDSYVRQENDYTDADDDGDTYNKAFWLWTGLKFFNDPGGDIQEGKTYPRMWSYMESETVAWTAEAFPGDESAESLVAGTWDETVAASALSDTAGNVWVPKTVHAHIVEKTSGRGVSFGWQATSPTGVVWKGFGGTKGPGPAYRGKAVAV